MLSLLSRKSPTTTTLNSIAVVSAEYLAAGSALHILEGDDQGKIEVLEYSLSSSSTTTATNPGVRSTPTVFEPHNNAAPDGGRNAWAVIIDASRYYYNYRHASNALSFYRTVKRLGIPDNQIILMLADDVACNARNAEPGRLFNDRQTRLDLYGEDVEVDFRGEEVTVDNVLRLLTGRQPGWTPLSKRLLTDRSSHIFFFLTGHGGDQFLKFQDWEVITSQDISNAFHQMYKQNRYGRILFLVDSCQSATLQTTFVSPNIVAAGCSKKGQNSYSHHEDNAIGVPIIDRFTYYALHFLEGLTPQSNATLQQFFDAFDSRLLLSEPEVRTDLSDKPLTELTVASFFSAGGVGSGIRFLNDETSPEPSFSSGHFPVVFAR
ncbi:uncharacterized protein LOC129618390 [Condylostylus longicornis]|uniref:uncharacterized protein LOC129618390 n=1 Tax=Condylostylus longicornis TaxID=2530218 RepID=UPI00244DB3C1|nr:uncharacterized protein LOC129618390 [Condylostylus longicornis]